MVWEQTSATKPHVAYALIGGFVTIFSLLSLFVKSKLYIGEASVAMVVGIIFGPKAAGIFDPATWGNTDYITLEVARIVIVVQVFAVGVELPKKYFKRHWRAITVMLVPVMASSWLICTGFIYALIPDLSFVESLVIAATLAPTDPVLASSVVGKGKFAERVPGHIRNLLSAESGCNDGMAFPFLYIGLYLLIDINGAKAVKEWVLITILYECIFGVVLGIIIGYVGRRAIRFAEERKLIDRESFLVFYFVLALFCAGVGTVIGTDDFLVAFSAGAAFAWDGWFSRKTEESHVSNVIDLLLNMAFFVYFGAIIPWDEFSRPDLSITPWRLVVIAILILLFRRIPGVMATYWFNPDIRNWREALFCGHFGPMGVGALFFSILARAELENESQVPAGRLPEQAENEHYLLIQSIYPIVSFMVLASIIVHGSSVAVFTLGKHINHGITLTFTRDLDDPSWLHRLPRLELGQSFTLARSERGRSRSRSRTRENAGGGVSKEAIGRNVEPSMRRRRRRSNEEKRAEGNEDERTPDERRDALQHHHQLEGMSRDDLEDAHFQQDGMEVYQEGDHFIVEDELGEVIREIDDPRKLSREAAHNVLDKSVKMSDIDRKDREQAAADAGHPLHNQVRSFGPGLLGQHEERRGRTLDSSSGSSQTLTRRTSADDTPEERTDDDNVEDNDDDDEETPAERKRRLAALGMPIDDDDETPAERKRRLQALGTSESSPSRPSSPVRGAGQAPSEMPAGRATTISFHPSVAPAPSNLPATPEPAHTEDAPRRSIMWADGT
ncbi:Na+/H+ antiporter [Savitreella phatthalungensis]